MSELYLRCLAGKSANLSGQEDFLLCACVSKNENSRNIVVTTATEFNLLNI